MTQRESQVVKTLPCPGVTLCEWRAPVLFHWIAPPTCITPYFPSGFLHLLKTCSFPSWLTRSFLSTPGRELWLKAAGCLPVWTAWCLWWLWLRLRSFHIHHSHTVSLQWAPLQDGTGDSITNGCFPQGWHSQRFSAERIHSCHLKDQLLLEAFPQCPPPVRAPWHKQEVAPWLKCFPRSFTVGFSAVWVNTCWVTVELGGSTSPLSIYSKNSSPVRNFC